MGLGPRTVVIGNGKSTLARLLATRVGATVHWQLGAGSKRDEGETRVIVAARAAKPRWIIAGVMAEKHDFATLRRSSWGDAVVLLATFRLTIFRDLTEGILVGFSLDAVLFINRMSQTTGIAPDAPLVPADKADDADRERTPYDATLANDPDVEAYRITGAFFFGAASTVGSVLDGIADRHKAFIVDFAAVPFLDSTAANAISKTAEKARRRGVRVFLTGMSHSVRRALLTHGARPPQVKYRADIAHAVAEIKARLAALRATSATPALH